MHGHNGRVEVHIEAEKLDARGMVQDFSDIKEAIKNWIDETLDHRMLLHQDDPLLPVLKQRGELFYVMDENPTAENIALVIHRKFTGKLTREAGPINLKVCVWESTRTGACYYNVV